jgi:hypothetical protein
VVEKERGLEIVLNFEFDKKKRSLATTIATALTAALATI